MKKPFRGCLTAIPAGHADDFSTLTMNLAVRVQFQSTFIGKHGNLHFDELQSSYSARQSGASPFQSQKTPRRWITMPKSSGDLQQQMIPA
jgi:hypothetical protein